MPPKKRSKVAASGRAAIPVLSAQAAVPGVPEGAPDAAAAAAAPAAAVVSPLSVGGIESLRMLAKHRPQRVAMGGMTIGGVGVAASAALAPPPQPVTLQIVDVRRYFVDHRFWALVGVPFPTLTPQAAQGPVSAVPVDVASSVDREGDVIMNGGAGAAVPASAAGAASASSVPAAAPASAPLASAFDAYSDLHTAYDLVVSDGSLQLKVLLSPTLSIHVEKGGVLPRGIVRISEAAWRFDETVVDDRGFLVVRAMEVLEIQSQAGLILTASAGAAEPQPLQYPAWASPQMHIDRPLIGGSRSYYLSLFNDDTVIFSPESYPALSEAERIAQEQKAIHQGVAETMQEERKDGGGGGGGGGGSSGSALIRRGRQAQLAAASAAASGRLPLLMQDSVLLEPEVLQRGDVTTIHKLITEGVGFQAGDLSLVVRVFAKSRIQTFGRKTVGGSGGAGELLRAPFNFELLVGDASGEQIKVVLWNTLVGTYFSRLHVGQILSLRGFRLKRARSDGHYELALNPYNPIGSVRVFDETLRGLSKDLADSVPPIVMTVSSVSGVAAMAEENIFDVAGVVTYAGPMLREFSNAKQSFFQYRWLLLADDSCMDALPIKLYTNSQQENLESVRVSDVVYISNLSVRSTLGSASPIAAAVVGGDAGVVPIRSLVATSTNYSQLLGPELMRNSGHPYLQRILEWAAQADHGLLRAYPSLFRWSLDFTQYKQLFGETLSPLREMRPIMDRLRFQQTRSVLFQAYIAQIIIHPAGLRAIQDGVMDEENYRMAIDRLKAIDEELAGVAAQPEEKKPEAAAAAASTKGKKGRGAKSVSMAVVDSKAVSASQPTAAELPASQVSTRSTRLRSSQAAAAEPGAAAAPSHRRGRSRGGVPEAASARASSESRGGRSSRSASRGGGGQELVRVRSMTPRKRKGKVVKTILRKRKQPAPAEAATAPGAAAPGAVGSPAASPAASASPLASAAAPSASVPAAGAVAGVLVPSSPSTLATILFRDLNGEFELAVELNDPVLGHVNFDQGVGTVAAACSTPREAPRIFHGLSHILPSSAFPPAAWDALIQAAAGVQPEEEADAAAAPAAASGAGPATKRGSKKKKGGAASTATASSASASPRAPRSPAALARAAIVQLHTALLSTLSPLRLLSSVTFTRRSYNMVHANLTSVFSAQQ